MDAMTFSQNKFGCGSAALDKNGFPVYVDEKRRVVPFATYYRPKHADTLAAFALEWYVP
jgi:hypothetical protein